MYIVIPIFSDGFIHQLHEKNKLSLLYVKELGGVGKMLQINHMDTLEKDYYDFLIDSTIITTDAKKLLTIHPFKNIYDINILNWWIDNKPLSEDVKNNAIDYMNNKYYNMKNVNYIIPSVKHLEWCDEVSKDIEQVWAKKDTIDFENYKQYNEEVVVAFTSIEKHGVKVVDNICDIFDIRVKKHISDGKLYSNYNLTTSTGRPSNAFGTVNFAALNNAQRRAFVPKNDLLVEYDYDAYHLRLIGDFIGYKFPQASVHEYLASFYGSTYEESKQITFKLLYGGISDKIAKSIPFFRKIKDYINEKWSEYNLNKFVSTDIYNRKLTQNNHQDMNRNKLFNYLIQAYETERNIKTIIELQKYLYDKHSTLVLYGYDSFTLDFNKKDGVDLLKQVKKILEQERYSTKVKAGVNLGEMNSITERL
jgi:hypothetical protein